MSKQLKTTIISMILLLATYFFQGAFVVINHIEGIEARLLQGAILWLLVFLTVLFCWPEHHNTETVGLSRIAPGSARDVLYYLPLILVAVLAFTGGIEKTSIPELAAFLFFTLAVGFAEEMYFRGLICGTWLPVSNSKAVLISSILFGCSHLMNIAGGRAITETLLQICFAFAYGLVAAQIFIRVRSIIPVALLHAFHDFCTYISGDRSDILRIVVSTLQFLLLAGYAIYLYRHSATEAEEQ